MPKATEKPATVDHGTGPTQNRENATADASPAAQDEIAIQLRISAAQLGEGAEAGAELVGTAVWKQLFNVVVRALPDRHGAGQQVAAFCGENEDAAALVGGVGRDFDEAAAFKRFQGGGQSGAVHGEQRSDRSHGRWLGTV